ncbi:MAG: hypothetical protein V2B20_27075 [Pseudomonadota bacterium]
MKIGIGGIKFSEELVHVSYCAVAPTDSTFTDLVKRIAENRINISFLCSGMYGDEILSTFCIAVTDFSSLARIIGNRPSLGEETKCRSTYDLFNNECLKITQHVGTFTLFPHRRSLALLGRIVEILGESGITIHSLCTSISALAINIDYPLLDLAVEVLGKIIELPDDHAPFRSDFCVKQVSL